MKLWHVVLILSFWFFFGVTVVIALAFGARADEPKSQEVQATEAIAMQELTQRRDLLVQYLARDAAAADLAKLLADAKASTADLAKQLASMKEELAGVSDRCGVLHP